jgi:primosomal protein N'
MRFVEVALHANVQSTFHYHVPPDLQDKLMIGHLVRVEFGTAMQPGIVLDYTPEPEFKTKPVLELLDPYPVVTHEHIDLARWMSTTYLAPLGDCLWLMLPPGLTGKSARRVTLCQPDFVTADPIETAILEQLRPTTTKLQRQLETALGAKRLRKPLEALAQQGIVKIEAVLAPPSVKPKTVRTVQASVPPIMPKLRHKAQALWDFLRQQTYPLEVTAVYAATGATAVMLNALVKQGLAQFGERLVWRDSLADRDFVASQPLALTDEQQQAWNVIRAAMRRYQGTIDLIRSSAPSAESIETDLTPSASPSTERGTPHEADRQVTVAHQSSQGAQDEIARRRLPSLKSGGEVALPDHATVAEQPPDERHWYVAPHLWQLLKTFARQMRYAATPAENILWQRLRNRRLGGYRFRRQHALERFIVDFLCAEAKLIIEVDGAIHQYTPAEDALRQQFLEALGFRVLRFTNEAVLRQLDQVLYEIEKTILRQLTADLTPSPSPSTERGTPHEQVAADRQVTVAHQSSQGAQDETARRRPPSLKSERGVGGEVVFLLHGVTGSGKTEIYLHAIAEVLAQGRQAIFLVPEIALTPQTIRRVAERFPDQVAVVHGSLSLGERYDTWRRARAGEVQVIVGTRSAVFTPLPDIGLIILDEEHDPSYKHAPPFNPPYYHARAVAALLMEINDGVLLLGSATPAIETMQQAQRGEVGYLRLAGRIMGHRQRIEAQAERNQVTTNYHALNDAAMTIELPPVHVVDMRDELKEGNRSMFSRALFFSLRDVLARREQAILFLNRRGQASYVFCRDCGYVAICNRCDMPMTYHRAGEKLHCHHCGNTQAAPTICPQCQSPRIRYFGSGTQQVEEELHKQFPTVRSLRWDADTAEKPAEHEAILAQFIAHEADVLVGTQMIAKGLDLPLVTLVGVINADPGLALPDFRAGERAFQVLTQVAGRAGRGVLGGRVILQTYQPLHDSIRLAAQHNYDDFFALEIERRRELGYPPFRRLARLLIQGTHPVQVQREAETAAELLRQRIAKFGLPDDALIGPAPCFFGRIDKQYRWQVLLRSTNPAQVLRDFPLRHGWWLDLDPLDVL